MNKVYVLIYDHDHGNREDCNIFYSPIEVFADAETREKRITLLSKTNPDIGYRVENIELSTSHDFDIPEHLLPYEDDEDENDVDEDTGSNMRDYEPPTDPSAYCFYVCEAPDMFGNDDDGLVTAVSITPIDYFKQTGYMYDQHANIELGDRFDEIMEGHFIYDGTVEEAREELLKLGLVEDADFAKMLQDYMDRVDNDLDYSGKTLAKNWGSLDSDADLGINTAPPKPFADYIFAAGLADDAWDDTEKVTTVYVAKREDFEKSGALSTDSLTIRMPWGFGEIDSGRYEYDGSIVVAKQLLIDLGMQEHDAFADYCSTTGLEVDRDFVNRVSTTPSGDLSIDMSGMVGPNGELDVNGFAQLAASLFDQSTKKG
jgi:hypothetical protein